MRLAVGRSGLTPADLAVVVRAAGLLVAVDLANRLLPLPTVARRVGVTLDLGSDAIPIAGAPRLEPRDRRRLLITSRVCRSWPLLGSGRCLRDALVLGRVLRHLQPVLRLGVAREEDRVLAHAWLEVAGGSLLADQAFAPLSRASARGLG